MRTERIIKGIERCDPALFLVGRGPSSPCARENCDSARPEPGLNAAVAEHAVDIYKRRADSEAVNTGR